MSNIKKLHQIFKNSTVDTAVKADHIGKVSLFNSLFGFKNETPQQPREGKHKGIIFSSGIPLLDVAIWGAVIWYIAPYIIYILAPKTVNILDHYTPLLSAVVILFDIVAIKIFSDYKRQALEYQAHIDTQIKEHESSEEAHQIEPFPAETHILNAKINILSVAISTNFLLVMYLFGDGKNFVATMLTILMSVVFFGLIWDELKRKAKVRAIIEFISAYRRTTAGKLLLTFALLFAGIGLLLLYRYLWQ